MAHAGSQNAEVAQSPEECAAFAEAFAKLTVNQIRFAIGSPVAEAGGQEQAFKPDWDSVEKLLASGLSPNEIDDEVRRGRKYLHIDVAVASPDVRTAFLAFSGLSKKQQRILFPKLSARTRHSPEAIEGEVVKLNRWLDEIRRDGFDPALFVGYQRALTIHGSIQNLSGAVGASGAVVAFRDAIEELAPGSIADSVGQLPPPESSGPSELLAWREGDLANRTVSTLLLSNGRAIVFSSSKDANIFQPLNDPFSSAKDALDRFNAVRNDQRARSQVLHEFAVGEVKTATDPANLHERMGLASRETQTELKTDRFLMMAILNTEILEGGVQGRVMNNRDLKRFSDVFNLHHCWGWDGGRERHADHWAYFKSKVQEWCGL